MKRVAYLSATAGLALTGILFARQDVRSIADLLLAAGPALVVAALFHVVPMIANAYAWQRLLSGTDRPGMCVMTWATWIRESVNSLLPVARIGGELVAYRIVRRHVTQSHSAAASLAADMAISMLSQAAFALLGLALLFAIGGSSTAATQLLAGILSIIALGAGFVVVQCKGTLSALSGMINGLLAGRFAAAHVHALAFDCDLRAVYQRHRDVARCFAWQLAGWVLGSGEIWLVLRLLAPSHGALDALAIEALIQAVGSAVFFVPAALGVQEGAFLVIGAALGLDAATALALATARRIRDVVIFLPGLIAWQWAEMWTPRATRA